MRLILALFLLKPHLLHIKGQLIELSLIWDNLFELYLAMHWTCLKMVVVEVEMLIVMMGSLELQMMINDANWDRVFLVSLSVVDVEAVKMKRVFYQLLFQ